MSLMDKMWADDSNKDWHPKEELFDLMTSCASLNHRTWAVVKPDLEIAQALSEKPLLDLANEGLTIQKSIQHWHSNFLEWSASHSISTGNAQSTLAIIYYHATSIYLSGIFDYRPHFSYILSPSLPETIIQAHVIAILSTTELALKTTNLGGVLFFYPLRVAGARARCAYQRKGILKMLGEISGSFVVANAFTGDLKALWSSNGSQ